MSGIVYEVSKEHLYLYEASLGAAQKSDEAIKFELSYEFMKSFVLFKCKIDFIQ